MLEGRPVRHAAPVDLDLLAGVVVDLDARDVGVRRQPGADELDAVRLGPAEDVLLRLDCDSRSKASRSWTQRMVSTWLPPAPRLPSGTSAASGASSRIGLAVPSMKPVRSRLSRWTKPVRSDGHARSSARGSARRPGRARRRRRACPPLIHSHRSCWVAGAWWPPSTPSGWNGRQVVRRVVRIDGAPQVGAEAQDDVDATGRHGRHAQAFQDGADGRQVHVRPELELEELVGDRALREDAELGQRHGRRLAHDERRGRPSRRDGRALGTPPGRVECGMPSVGVVELLAILAIAAISSPCRSRCS